MIAPAVSESELLTVAQQLPASPRLLVELGQIIRRPFVTTAEIVARLRQDTGLVSRLISVANSAAYARAEPAGSIEEAVATLGFREVHRLVGAVASRQLADQPLSLHGITGARLRENALFVAVVMEELAEATGEDPRSCYTVGLLRSIGKMALDRTARGDIPPFAGSGEPHLAAWEVKHWGMHNCRVAQLILEHWRMPLETVISIQHHYEPTGLHNPVIHLLKLAAVAAQDRYFSLPGEQHYFELLPENFTRAGVTERQYHAACERAQRTFERLHSAVT
jgi:HD-like signal output (HDOD) protein